MNKAIPVALDHFGLLRVSGQDAEKFLQGQLSCDVQQIDEHQAKYAIYANLKGRIVANCLVFKWQDDYYLRLSRDLVTTVKAILAKYAVFSKLTLTDCSDEFSRMGFYRADSAFCPGEGKLVALPMTKQRYEYYSMQQPESDTTVENSDVWRRLDIEAGIANVNAATSALFLPHRINYQHLDAINFKKGCYLGQEVIARMHYRSTIKHHARIIASASQPLAPGQSLYHPGTKAQIASVIDYVDGLALITIADEFVDLTQLKDEQKSFDIQFHPLPYAIEDNAANT